MNSTSSELGSANNMLMESEATKSQLNEDLTLAKVEASSAREEIERLRKQLSNGALYRQHAKEFLQTTGLKWFLNTKGLEAFRVSFDSFAGGDGNVFSTEKHTMEVCLKDQQEKKKATQAVESQVVPTEAGTSRMVEKTLEPIHLNPFELTLDEILELEGLTPPAGDLELGYWFEDEEEEDEEAPFDRWEKRRRRKRKR